MPAPRNLTASPTREERSHPTAILAIICISYFMVILDNSIIFTGLPRIESANAFSPTGLSWVQANASATAALVERVTTALTGAAVMLAVVAAPPVIGAVAELSA